MANSSPSSTTTPPLTTPLTTLLHLSHPILLAGMAHASTAPLAAAVSNAGGLGTIGGLGYSPTQLREMMRELKALLKPLPRPHRPSTTSQSSSSQSPLPPFGVDLALPALGGTARKTNHDYTKGQLDGLIDVIISEGATLFVSAVGIPPPQVISRLHAAGVVVMNMVGHPKHARKAFAAGVDIVCAQGGEGGGHTGEIPMGLLVPACMDESRNWRPPLLNGGEGLVVAAGGIFDGRGLASALAMGAAGVWVGTRFVASEEAGASRLHKEAVVSAGWEDTVKTLVVTGRPLRAKRNEYLRQYEEDPKKKDEVRSLTSKGIVPLERDMEEDREEVDFPFLMGQVAACIGDVKPAGQIVEDMAGQAAKLLRQGAEYVSPSSSVVKNESEKRERERWSKL